MFENVKDELKMERRAFERIVIHAIEDYYEYEFKDLYNRKQYRTYLRQEKDNEIVRDMIYYEVSFCFFKKMSILYLIIFINWRRRIN